MTLPWWATALLAIVLAAWLWWMWHVVRLVWLLTEGDAEKRREGPPPEDAP
jgi:hypothetical protein